MARSFNGTTNLIAFNQILTSPFSISAWVNTVGSRSQGIIGGNGQNEIYLRLTAGNALNFLKSDAVNIATSSGTITASAWNHVGLSYDGTNYVFYINGAVAGSGSSAQTFAGLSTATIGVGNVNDAEYYSGSIAEIGWWNVVLTATEFAGLGSGARLYTIRNGSLKAYFPLDGVQSPEPDLSGNKNNGTLTGTSLAAGAPLMQFTPRWPILASSAAAAAASAARYNLRMRMGVGV